MKIFVNLLGEHFCIVNSLCPMNVHYNQSGPADIKGSSVARVDTYTYLGIVLNNKLTWGDHVDFIGKKLNSRMYCLRKTQFLPYYARNLECILFINHRQCLEVLSSVLGR